MPTIQQQLDADLAKHGNPDTPGLLESGVRGLYSGVTSSFAPGADQTKQEDAWREHPGAYGGGYAAGTGLSLLGPGLLGKGIAAAAGTARGAGLVSKIPILGESMTAAELATGSKVPQVLQKAGTMVPEVLKGKAAGATVRGAASVGGNISNTPTQTPPQAGELGMNAPDTGAFPELQKYLAQATDADAKRKIAMELASSEGGRAVSNSDSPLNEDNQLT